MLADRTQTMSAQLPLPVVLTIMMTGDTLNGFATVPSDLTPDEAQEVLIVALDHVRHLIGMRDAKAAQEATQSDVTPPEPPVVMQDASPVPDVPAEAAPAHDEAFVEV